MAVSPTSLQTPWHVYAKLEYQDAKAHFHIMDPDKQDIEQVVNWYLRRPVPGKDIKSVKIIHNPQMGRMFQGRVELLELRNNQPSFFPRWEQECKTPEEVQQRKGVVELFKKHSTRHSYSKFPHVSLLPLWHGWSRKADKRMKQAAKKSLLASLLTKRLFCKAD